MRVFVAGASGTIGLPVVRRLIAEKHEVVGLSRTAAGAERIEGVGARAVIGDALDGDTLERILLTIRPSHVLHLLTAIPKQGAAHPRDLRATNALRTRGTANLLRASIGAGVKRIVAESFAIAYGVGDLGVEPLGEASLSVERHPDPSVQAIVDAARALETQLVAAAARGEIETIVLRFGFLYGPGVPSTEAMLEGLRRRKLPLIRKAQGLGSFVHIDDAAAATIAALTAGESGAVYNIADDRPTALMDFLREAAAIAGAPRPRTVPRWIARLAAPLGVAIASARLPMSNARAKRELAWTPRLRSPGEGLKAMAAAG
jgi:nucleoside-diphosphate-sugar epimerase